MMATMNSFISGALVMGYLTVAVFFLRFYRQTKESLFGFFALSFLLFAASRLALVLIQEDEQRDYLYWIRLLAALVLLVGIVRKNLRPAQPGG